MRSEQGNVVIYLLVGLVLFAGLLGSAWWVKSRSATPMLTPAPAPTAQNKSTTETTVPQDDGGSTSVRQGTANPQDTAATAPAPSTSTTPEDSAAMSQDPTPQAPAASSATPALPESRTSHVGTTDVVAASGPTEDIMMSLAALGSVSFATVQYLRSRRA